MDINHSPFDVAKRLLLLLTKGLRQFLRGQVLRAGVPFGYQSRDQLTGEEIRSLVFGQELHGRQINSGEP